MLNRRGELYETLIDFGLLEFWDSLTRPSENI